MSKSLSKITVHLNDLTTVQLDAIPEKLETLSDIVRSIRKEGCFAYTKDECVYVFPTSITKIVFVRTDDGLPEEEPEVPEED